MVSEGEEERSEVSEKRRDASISRRRKFLSVEPVPGTQKANWNASSRRKCCSVESTLNKQSVQSGCSDRSFRSAEETSKHVRNQSDNFEKESRANSSEATGNMRRRRKSRRSRSKKRKTHKCSMLCNKCPDSISHRDLVQAAAVDRQRRERITIGKMMESHGMDEVMLFTAMKRQTSYTFTRGMALFLQCFCVIGCAVMAVLAQRVFNTRGNLNFYLCAITFELFLLFVALCNVIAPSHISRFSNVIVFVCAIGVNFLHVLVVARSEGLFWNCMEGDVILQHCFLFSIPSHYHTLYTAGFHMFLHVAIALLSVAVTIFYDGSLDCYIDNTPGAPQWITSEPLHRHQRLEEARSIAKKRKALIEKLSKAELQISDLPPGTTITREQSEKSVRTTTYDRLGKANVGPEHVTMSRSYTLKTPGNEPVTSKRKWVVKRHPTGSSVVPAKDVKTTPVPANVVVSRKAEAATGMQAEKPKEATTHPEEKPEPIGKPTKTGDQPFKPIGKPIDIEDYPSVKSKQCYPRGKPVEIPSDMKPLESRNIGASAGQPGTFTPVGKPVEVPSDMKPLENRYMAGKEEEEIDDDLPPRISRMPALISPLAYLASKNKSSVEKQSDYMY